jgi:hypothetical protein
MEHEAHKAALAASDELAGHRHLLGLQLEQLERLSGLMADGLEELAAGGAAQNQWLENSPAPGRRRFIQSDRSAGQDAAPIALGPAMSPVLPAQPGRLGGVIVNAGANPVTLYLAIATASPGGRAAIWLPAGATWLFLLGNVLWTGPVSAIATTAPGTLTVATV